MSATTASPIPPQGPNDKRKRLGLIAALLVVISGLLAGAGLIMVNRGDSAQAVNAVFSESPVAAPVFEPRDARGDDPFFPLEMQVARFRIRAEADNGVAMTGDQVQALDDAVKTGLYGGTEENTCDPEQLISFLYANPELGEVWASVQGIAFNEIATYIRSLDARILAEPANVLNHGFDPSTGGAYQIDTILDAGTAVLVDANGDVRARCYCGNPIKPKPPQYRPPRCVVFGAAVMTEPAGTTPATNVASIVELTGQQASTTSGIWLEISWDDNGEQTAWAQSINLRDSYCPPPHDNGMCPGPGVVDVYAEPNTATKVGELNGTLNTVDGPTEIHAPISRVGGPDGFVVDNGFVLIRFVQAAPSLQNSAWVQVSRLAGDDCAPVAQCVNTEFAAKHRPGGIDVRPAGEYKVEFTGHYTADRASTQVRFLDGGQTGWITNFYTPLPWTDCQQDPVVDPVVKCVRKERGTVIVFNSATTTNPADLVGNISNTPVTLVGNLTPTNGRVEIEMGPGGPIGWIDASRLDGNFKYCQPRQACVTLTGPAWSNFRNSGTQVPGTPGGPMFVDAWSVFAIDPEIVPLDIHFLLEVDGQTGWISRNDVSIPADQSCGNAPIKPTCPTTQGTSTPDAAEKAGNAELDSALVDAIGEDTLRELSIGNTGACCLTKAVFDSDAANNETVVVDPVAVSLTGATNEGGTWYEIATVHPGKWAPAVNFVDPAQCQPIANPCQGTQVGIQRGGPVVPDNACCVGSKVLDEDGTSLDINPAQFAEYVRTVTDKGDFIYEMQLVPAGNTIFAGPDALIATGDCAANLPEPVECPVINGVSSQVASNAIRVVACCADADGDGPVVITLEGTIDVGDGTDPSVFEYLTNEYGWRPAEVFRPAADCIEPAPPADAQPDPVADPVDDVEPEPTSTPEPTATPAPTATPEPDPSPDQCQADRDNDGVCDNVDNCPRVPNPNQDNSSDGPTGDACRPQPDPDACTGTGNRGDRDQDGVCNEDDNCPSDVNPEQENTFGGSAGDACENPDPCDGNDKDGDQVCDKDDNCPGTPNADQADDYGDRRGNACEEPCPKERINGNDCCKEGTLPGGDGECYLPCPVSNRLDLVRNRCEQKCPDASTAIDGAKCPPECPIERSNPDNKECCPAGTEYYHGACYVMCGQDQPDLGDGCGPCRARGGDSDADRICDRDDNCPLKFNPEQTDKDRDGKGDACDDA